MSDVDDIGPRASGRGPRSEETSESDSGSGSESGSESGTGSGSDPDPDPDSGREPGPEVRGAVARDPRRRIVVLVLALAAVIIAAIVVIPRVRGRALTTAVLRDAAPPGPLLPRDERPTLTPVKGTGAELLAGVVVDGAGAPVSGVAVTAELESSSSPSTGGAGLPSVVVAVTTTDGRFTLEGMNAGRHHLVLEGNEVFTAELRYVPVPSDELRLVVARRVNIVGTVVDRGAPQAGATVTIDGDTMSGTRTTTTDDTGHFAFDELPEGSYRAWAWRGDLVARARRVPRLGRGPFAPVELVVEQGAIVVGKVVDRQTGGGVAAAVVITPLADAEGEEPDEAPRFARTLSDGVFRIEGVPDGRWSADAWAPGWITIGSVDFAAGRGTPQIEMVPGGIVEGRVLGPDGRPMAGVTVAALEDARGGGKEISAAADEDRLRRFSGQGPRATVAPAATAVAAARPGDTQFLPRGELGVMLGPSPYPPPAGTARTWQARIVDAPQPSSGAATVTTADAGVPNVGAGAVIAPLTVDPAYQPIWTTGADGTFRLTGVPAGAFWIVGNALGHPPARARVTLTLGQVLTGVELRLADGVYVGGRVTNQRGEPVVGALLSFSPKDGPERLGVIESVADGDGRYRAGPVTGVVVVHATAHGHGETTVELDTAPRPGADPTADRPLDVTLVVADAALEGLVEDPAGLPVIGARVVVDGGPAGGRTATTADGGRFRLTLLTEGELAVRVEHSDYPPQRFTERTGDGVRIRLAYGGGLELMVLDHHTGDPVLGVTLDATGPGGEKRQLDTSAKGRTFAVPLAPGKWTVVAAVPGYVKRSLVIEVPAGDRPAQITARDQRLELERGAVIAGIVRDRRGDRVAGAKVVVRRGDVELGVRTDALGEFRLRDVPTGLVELRAEKGGASGTQSLELRAGDERLSLDVVVN